jgi:uncharacterized repeat protein (TIGR01451 family)
MNKNQHINGTNSRVAILGVAACVLLLVFIPFGNYSARAAAPILKISVLANRSTASPGDEIIYTLTYRNTGDAAATGIVVKNPLTGANQSYLEFVSANPTPDSGNNTWIIDGPFRPGESGQITITVKVKSSLSSNWLTIIDQASIDSNETTLKYSNYASVFISSVCRLSIAQTVRNITKNSIADDLISADSGDEIEFSMEIEVIGTNQAANTRIWDRLSSHFEYISGSATINGSSLNDEVVDDGVYVGDLLTGATRTVKFRARVSSSSGFYVGKNYLRSYGYVDADICMAKSSIATVVVEKKSSSGSLTVLSSSGLTITKLARNVTKKSTGWGSTIYANPGDEIEFSIKIKSTRENDMSVRVEDVLPPKMYYISDSTRVDGNYESDGITTKNVYLAHVYKNLTREIKFKVRMAQESEFSLYPISLANKASAWGNEGKEISDTVKIIVNQPSKSSTGNVGINTGQSTSQPSGQTPTPTGQSEEVKGAETVKTGFDYFKFSVISIISVILAFFLYCRIREKKLLEILNNGKRNKLLRSIIRLYFRVRLFFKIRILKFKKA